MVHVYGEEGYHHELITLLRIGEEKFVWNFVKICKIIKEYFVIIFSLSLKQTVKFQGKKIIFEIYFTTFGFFLFLLF
jgi:hypothetical protein